MSNTESSPKDFDLVVVGDVNPDLVLRGDVTPVFGQVEKILDDATLTIGSSSCIFACGAARLGLRVTMIGKIGRDQFGQFMLQQLIERGVDVSGMVIDEKLKTGLSVILSRGNDRAILTYSETISALRYEEINLDLVARANHLHMGGFFMLDQLRPDIPAFFQKAHQMGLTVSLDTNYDHTEKWDLADVLEHTDIFLPNETEICALTGLKDLQAACNKLSARVPLLGVKLGPNGGMACMGPNITRGDAIKVDVVDTTGAGDSFDAGLIYGYLKHWPMEKTIQFACVCGSLSTCASGGTDAQPTLIEALQRMPTSGF